MAFKTISKVQQVLTTGIRNLVDLNRNTWTKALTLDFAFTYSSGGSLTDTDSILDYATNIELSYDGSNTPITCSMRTLAYYFARIYNMTTPTFDALAASQTDTEAHVKMHIDFAPADNIRSNRSPFADPSGMLPFNTFDTVQLAITTANPDSSNITALACTLTVLQHEYRMDEAESAKAAKNGVVMELIEDNLVLASSTSYANEFDLPARGFMKTLFMFDQASAPVIGDWRFIKTRPNEQTLIDSNKDAYQEYQKALYNNTIDNGIAILDLDALGTQGMPMGQVKGDYKLTFNATGAGALKILQKRWSKINA